MNEQNRDLLRTIQPRMSPSCFAAVSLIFLLSTGAPAESWAQAGTVDLVDTTDVRAVAVSSTGLAVALTRDGGVLRSHDWGATWGAAPFDTTKIAYSVTICDDNSVFIGAGGLYRSTDAASTWTHVGDTAGPWAEMLCLPGTTDILLGGGSVLNLYALRENGTRYDSLFASPIAGGRFTIGRGVGDSIVVGFSGCLEDTCGRLLISGDRGLTFKSDSLWNPSAPVYATAITETGALHAQSWEFAAVRHKGVVWSAAQWIPDHDRIVPLRGDSLLAATGDGLLVSADAGVTWQSVSSPYAEVPARDAAMFDDGTILAATSGGIVRIRGAVPTSVENEHPMTADSPASVEVYPNPFGSSMMVRTSGVSCSGPIELLDITGRRIAVIAEVNIPGVWTRYESRRGLSAGPYVVAALCNDKTASTLVIHLTSR